MIALFLLYRVANTYLNKVSMEATLAYSPVP